MTNTLTQQAIINATRSIFSYIGSDLAYEEIKSTLRDGDLLEDQGNIWGTPEGDKIVDFFCNQMQSIMDDAQADISMYVEDWFPELPKDNYEVSSIEEDIKQSAIDTIEDFLGSSSADTLYEFVSVNTKGNATQVEVARLVSIALNEAIDGIKAA